MISPKTVQPGAATEEARRSVYDSVVGAIAAAGDDAGDGTAGILDGVSVDLVPHLRLSCPEPRVQSPPVFLEVPSHVPRLW